ncbi:MAG: hypothetical protein ACP6IP_01570 [Candidatus Njordarchaeia archaeon]
MSSGEDKDNLKESESDLLKELLNKILSLDPARVDERLETYTDIAAKLYKLRKMSTEEGIFLEISLEVEGEEGGKIKTGFIRQGIIITVGTRRAWVSMRAPLYPLDRVREKDRYNLLLEILQANYKGPEFAFDVDDKGIIGVSEDVFVPALTFDVFLEEFTAILEAIKYFYSVIAPKYNLDINVDTASDVLT